MKTAAVAIAPPQPTATATAPVTAAAEPKPKPKPTPRKPAPVPPKRPLPAPGPDKALSLRERIGTALYYGVQPPTYSYLAANHAVQTTVALAGIAALTPIVATEQALEAGVSSAYQYLHDAKTPDAPVQRVAGIARHLLGDGLAGGAQSLAAAYTMGGQGLITAAASVPVAGLAAVVGFGTLGITVPLACLYGAVRREVRSPSQFFEEVRKGKQPMPQG